MYFIFTGNDYQKKKKKLEAVKRSMILKKPDAEVSAVDSFDIDNDIYYLESLLATVGLFESKSIISFVNVLENEKIKKFFFENLENFQKSENAFIFSEDKLSKIDFKKAEKYAYQAETFEKPEIKFNLFSLTELLARKDKKNLWLKYHEALEKENAESVYNILLWQVKTLLLVEEKKDLQKTGLKPFVFGKATSALRNWKKGQAEEKYLELLDMQYKNRKYSQNLDNMLEKFILEL